MRKCLLALLFLVSCSLLFAQQTMNNDAVVKLVKAGLSDDLIVSTINASPGTYDTSADGLIALKAAGASDKVVAAVVTRNSGSGAAAMAPQPAAAIAPQPAATRTPAAVAPPPPPVYGGRPTIFIKAEPDFAVALSAAMTRKEVPATLVTDESSAQYTLLSASVNAKQESTGGKIARCLFAYCAGIEGNSNVSVQLIRNSDKSVAWAYQVRKGNGGPSGIQSLSEAVAKHLKNDFLKKN